MSKVFIGTKAKIGENYPESGIWQVFGTPSTTAPTAKGNSITSCDAKWPLR